MLAIPNLRKTVASALLFVAAVVLVSCATDKDTRLVSDPDERPETTMPWNKQEKWESGGGSQLANMMDGRR
jgi:hypothetical protein